MSKDRPLTDMQELFCKEYLVDLNATEAAKRAKYSEKTAAEQGYQLLQKPSVRARVLELMDARAKRVETKSDRVLEELERIGTSDLIHAFADNNTLLPLKDMPEDMRRAIASIEVDEIFEGSGESRTWVGYTKKVKLWPKDRGLELTGKHLKLFTDKVELSGKFTLEDLAADPKGEDKPE